MKSSFKEVKSQKCVCGKPLPVHFLDLGGSKFTHVCSCERAYKIVKGKFVESGRESNPFAKVKKLTAAQIRTARRKNWENMTGCSCTSADADDRCTKRRVCCESRLKRISEDNFKQGLGSF